MRPDDPGGADSELRFSRHWWTLALVSLLVVPVMAAVVYTGGFGATGGAGLTLAGLVVAIVEDLCLLAGAVVLYAIPLRTLLTRFDDEGVRQPGLRGWSRLRWADVAGVGRPGAYMVALRGSGTTITLNLLLFADPQAVHAAIVRRVPPGALR